MYAPVIVTAVLVSLDALFVGMSLKLQKGFKWRYLFIIAAIILALCTVAYFAAGGVRVHMNLHTGWIIGLAFVLLGVKNLFTRDEAKITLSVAAIIVLGLVMSIDGVVATVVLSIDQMHTFWTPVLMPVGHLAFLVAGCFAARFIKCSHKWHNIISAACLFLVAVANFTGLF